MVDSVGLSAELTKEVVDLTNICIAEMGTWDEAKQTKFGEVEAKYSTEEGKAELKKEIGELFAKHSTNGV